MSQQDLFNKIKYLISDAQFSIHEDDGNFMGEGVPISLDGYLVSWGSANAMPCPSQKEITQIDSSSMESKKEADRKLSRNKEKGSDLAIIAAFEIEKKSNPDLQFSDYLDYLEDKVENS
jgi:hypothetical protein